MKYKLNFFIINFILFLSLNYAAERYIRVNQVGYLASDIKVANLFSNDNLTGATFSVKRIADNVEVFGPASIGSRIGNAYCNYTYHYKLDFSSLTTPGTYKIVLNASPSAESYHFAIGDCVYANSHETILNFFRAQRCGFNPYLNVNCHTTINTRKDAKAVGGPNAGTVYNAEGGWHDAGDYIKFMINNAAVTFLLLFAYKENPGVFNDNYLANGLPGSNGIPDVLDEAKYGLDWIMKMHPAPSEFYYQVADGIDHNQWRLPQNDSVNGYSTTPYRPMYHCDAGKGANVAGKAAAALALGFIIFNSRGDTTYANTCLMHAEQIYSFGKSRMSAQPSTNGFYNETTFYDDMELAAAELYKATGNSSYLTDAQNYAQQAGSAWGWTDWGTLNFYAHYELYPSVGTSFKNTLKGYMQSDLNSGFSNLDVFGMNTTQYIWGSMALLSCNILNAYLYKKLFPSETTYDNVANFARDYVLGKNQWSVSFIVGLGTDYPNDPHHQIARINNVDIFGMPIEGPVTQANWNSYGAKAPSSDPYAAFQSSQAIYYDYWEDYSTNEPTIWQAGVTFAMLSLLSQPACFSSTPTNTPTNTVNPTATLTFTPTKTNTATLTSTFTNTRTNTQTFTATPTKTNTATLTDTLTSTRTITNTLTSTSTGTNTITFTFTTTNTFISTQTSSSTNTLTRTSTNTPSYTATQTYTRTNTATSTYTVTQTITGTQISTWTNTYTETMTHTLLPTNTFTNTFTQTVSYTNTNTATQTNTMILSATATNTLMPTFSLTLTSTATTMPTNTLTFTFTLTKTSTAIPTNTQTRTYTATYTYTSTMTNTQIVTMSYTATQVITVTPTETCTEDGAKIEVIKTYPNPLKTEEDLKIKVRVNKRLEEIKVKIYTVGYRNIMDIGGIQVLAGENEIMLNRAKIKNLAKGIYYYVIIGRDESGKQMYSKINSFIYMK